MLPILLDVKDRLCVVVGGGVVGQRKAATLLESGARVRLVCLECRPADASQGNLQWVTGAYGAAHLNGAALAIAAATAEVNRQVVADARARGIWVNAATDPEQGDFFLPAVIRHGDLTVAVGTGGGAPALSRQVRDLLQQHVDEAFGQWTALVAELRPIIHSATQDAVARQALLERLCDRTWLDRLRTQPTDAVRAAMIRAIS